MKSYKEIKEDINSIIQELDNQKKDIANTERSKERLQKQRQFDKLYEFHMMKIEYLKNNAKIALFKEVMPIILKIIKEYEGQRYDVDIYKILSKEIEERTNCRFYILSYKQVYLIQHIDMLCSFEVKSRTNKELIVNGNIQLPLLEDLDIVLPNTTYISNVDATVEVVLDVRKQIKRKQEEIKDLIFYHNTKMVNPKDFISY